MKRHFRGVMTGSVLCILPAVLPSLSAASEGPADIQHLPDISVTAKGYAADVLATPQSVTVLENDQRAAQTVPGALFRGEPGLAVQSDGAWGQNPVIRGLDKESIVLMVDGVRVNSAQPQGALASMLDMGLLEQVEVVKGPTSVLYGSGAMGGTVNLRTPEPRFSSQPEQGGRVSLTGSSVDRGAAGSGVYRLSGRDHAMVLGVAARRAGDYDSPEGRVDRTGYRSQSGLFKYHLRAAEHTRLKVNLQHHRDEDVWYPGSTREGGKPGGAGVPPMLGKVTIRSPRQHRSLYELGLEQDIGDGQFSAALYRQDVYRQIRAWSDNLGRDYVRNAVDFETVGLRARHLFALGADHLVTVGLEAWRMEGDPRRFIDQPPKFIASDDVLRSPFRHGQIDTIGLFAQDEWMLGDTTVLLGARYDRVSGNADQKGFGPNAQTTGLEKTDNNLSWSVGVVHAFSELFNPYVNVGQAYRAADMRERFEDSARGDGYFHVGNPQLDPERSLSIEVGMKGLAATLEYRLAAFHTRIDDYIAGRITGQSHPMNGLPIKRTENLDKVTIYGFEGQVARPLGFGVVDLGFTWLRGQNHQDDEPLAWMPPPEATLGFGQPARSGFHWRAAVRAVARQDRVGTRFTNGTENVTPGFATVDLRMGWKTGSLGGPQEAGVELRVDNLLDRGYHEHLAEGVSGQEIPAPGIGASLNLTGRF
ncbi:MAG: TonB-dependent receptor plug domain-containing protein [Halothiobacillaceae bacterium]